MYVCMHVCMYVYMWPWCCLLSKKPANCLGLGSSNPQPAKLHSKSCFLVAHFCVSLWLALFCSSSSGSWWACHNLVALVIEQLSYGSLILFAIQVIDRIRGEMALRQNRRKWLWCPPLLKIWARDGSDCSSAAACWNPPPIVGHHR
jgi:hypothetical protein